MLTDEQIEQITGASRTRASMWLVISSVARAIEAEVRKEDEALILQLTLALEMPCQWRSPRQNQIVGKAIGDARARLNKEPK